jgi:3-oxoacyl-[acyl-carrier protein] reductase
MLDKPVAIVTGASQGIGQAIAIKFSSEGYAVALTGRNEANLEKTAKIIADNSSQPVCVIPADLRQVDQIENIVRTTIKNWNRIDILVNNAGIMHLKPFLELSLDNYEEMMDVNVRAVFLLTQKVLPHMISQQSGSIVNVASLAGKNGFKTGTGYGATKFAIRGFAASLMMEVREHGIRVVTVFPGSVDTPLLNRSPNAPRRETMLQVEDVAHAVFSAVSVNPRAMISEVDIRPTNPKKG